MKKRYLMIFSILLLFVILFSGCTKNNSESITLDASMYPEPLQLGSRITEKGGKGVIEVEESELAHLTVSGEVNFQETQSMLKQINAYRKEKGLSKVTVNKSLMNAAQLRVVETTLCYSHIRPNQLAPSSVNENIEGEILGAGDDADLVFEKWCNYKNNANLLANDKVKSVGICNFGNQGHQTFWVIVLSTKELKTCKISNDVKKVQETIAYDANFCPVEFVIHQEGINDSWEDISEINLGRKINLQAVISPYLPNVKETETGKGAAIIQPKQLKWLTANPYVATVNQGVVTSQSDGKTVIDAVFGSYIGAKQIYSGDSSAMAKVETGSVPTFLTSKFNVYGHRGFSGKYPENSILSFIKAAECSAFDGMENDVHTTKDGQIVVMHDDTLDRMTSVNGKISNITFDQSRKIKLTGGSGYTTALNGKLSIPTLTEYLDICYRYQKIAMIELKEFANYEKDVPALVAYLNDYKNGWFKTHTIFISFNTDLLNAVANCTTVYPLEVMPKGKEITVSKAKELFNKVLKGRQEDYTLIFRPSVGQLYRSGIDQFKKKTIALDCWGLKTGDQKTFNQLQEDGVLGITLDSPEGLGLDMSVTAPINN